MTQVHLIYWAGARAAAGTPSEVVTADTVRAALGQVRRAHGDPHFDRVLGMCVFLVDGRTLHRERLDDPLAGDVEVHVLPPYAGG